MNKISFNELENCPNERISNGGLFQPNHKVEDDQFIPVKQPQQSKPLCSPFHCKNNPFNNNNNSQISKQRTDKVTASCYHKKEKPIRSLEKRANFIGTGPPGLHFKFGLNGAVKVILDYLEYFDWKKLMSDSGITITELIKQTDTIEKGIKESNEQFKFPKPCSPPVSTTPISEGNSSQDGNIMKLMFFFRLTYI